PQADDVLLGGHKTGLRQVQHLRLGQLRNGIEIELMQRLGLRELGGPQTGFQTPPVPRGVGVHAPTPSNASYRRGSPTGTAGPRGSRADASRRPSSRLSSNWRMPSAWQVPAAGASWIA